MQPLKFESLHSSVDAEFWYTLEKKKLMEYKLDNAPKPIFAEYHSGDHLAFTSSKLSDYGCLLPGIIHNANTKEEFDMFDKYKLLKEVAQLIHEDIKSGKWLENPSNLNKFLLLSFANLKDHVFHYWFGFPAIVPEESVQFSKSEKLVSLFDSSQMESLQNNFENYRFKAPLHHRGYFLIDKKTLNVCSVSDWISLDDFHVGIVDPSNLESYPAWTLKNYLIAACTTFNKSTLQVICYRENPSKKDISTSIYFEVVTTKLLGNELKCVGWEKNERDKNAPRRVDVGFMMDPVKLAESSVSLNLNLMKWRFFPSLELDKCSKQKCLLIGSGTLGCQVARNLLAWGIFNITFVDRSKVSFSNPVRQPLYEFEDCLNGGKPKAKCAADHILKIYPKANVDSYELDIPMPGHIVTNETKPMVKESVELLTKLIQSHDVIFLLTDSRESRWLPTLLGAKYDKLVMTVALGFESFVVMRHGSIKQKDRLGCYFCNDVVAPVDSSKDRTLDQQCTVTRPGTSSISGGLAVELLVSLLQHPMGSLAPASKEQGTDNFGLVPHQIRGSLSAFQQLSLTGSSYHQCTACSNKVLDAFEQGGLDFLIQVFNSPNILEDLTGLSEMKKMTEAFIVEEEEGFDLL